MVRSQRGERAHYAGLQAAARSREIGRERVVELAV